MRRIIMVLSMAALMGAMMATSGASASAQSPCPPTGPSGGPATLVSADEPLGAGFVCLDEEAQEFFCPPDFELWHFSNPGSDPAFVSECVQPSSASDGGEPSEWQQAEPESETPAGSVCDTVGGGNVVINGYQVC
jgi:hypothetical protein